MESSLAHTVFAPSIVYSPGDPFLRLLERLSLLPAVPLSGPGRARFQPIWAEDVADCVLATLPGGPFEAAADGVRYELAGPETLTCEDMFDVALRSFGRRRPIVKVPRRIARRSLRAVELLTGPAAFATWDEAQLLDVAMTSRHGTADAERLGVVPKPMRAVLGVG
jgi:NADH dehydrogenase